MAQPYESALSAFAYYLDSARSNGLRNRTPLHCATHAMRCVRQSGGTFKGTKAMYPSYSVLMHANKTHADASYNAPAFKLAMYNETKFYQAADANALGGNAYADAVLIGQASGKSLKAIDASHMLFKFGGEYPVKVPRSGYYVLSALDFDSPGSGAPELIAGQYGFGAYDQLQTIPLFSREDYGTYVQNSLPVCYLDLQQDSSHSYTTETTVALTSTGVLVEAEPSVYSIAVKSNLIGATLSGTLSAGTLKENVEDYISNKMDPSLALASTGAYCGVVGNGETSVGQVNATKERYSYPALRQLGLVGAAYLFSQQNAEEISRLADKLFVHKFPAAGAKHEMNRVQDKRLSRMEPRHKSDGQGVSPFEVWATLLVARARREKKPVSEISGSAIGEALYNMYKRAYQSSQDDMDFLKHMPLPADFFAFTTGLPPALVSDPALVLKELLDLQIDLQQGGARVSFKESEFDDYIAKHLDKLLPESAAGTMVSASAVANLLTALMLPDSDGSSIQQFLRALTDAPNDVTIEGVVVGSLLAETHTQIDMKRMLSSVYSTPYSAAQVLKRCVLSHQKSSISREIDAAVAVVSGTIYTPKWKTALNALPDVDGTAKIRVRKGSDGILIESLTPAFGVITRLNRDESSSIYYVVSTSGTTLSPGGISSLNILMFDTITGFYMALSTAGTVAVASLLTNPQTLRFALQGIATAVRKLVGISSRGMALELEHLKQTALISQTAAQRHVEAQKGIAAGVASLQQVSTLVKKNFLFSSSEPRVFIRFAGEPALTDTAITFSELSSDNKTLSMTITRRNETISGVKALFDEHFGAYRIARTEDDEGPDDPLYFETISYTFKAPEFIGAQRDISTMLWGANLYARSNDLVDLRKEQAYIVHKRSIATATTTSVVGIGASIVHDPYNTGSASDSSMSMEYIMNNAASIPNTLLASNPHLAGPEIRVESAPDADGRGMINTPMQSVGYHLAYGYHGGYPYYSRGYAPLFSGLLSLFGRSPYYRRRRGRYFGGRRGRRFHRRGY